MAKTALVAQERPNSSKNDGLEKNKPNPLVEQTHTHYQNARSFLEDVRAEMRKVVTPSRKEVQATTTVVLVTVFIFAFYFWIVDYIFFHGLTAVVNKLAGPQ